MTAPAPAPRMPPRSAPPLPVVEQRARDTAARGAAAPGLLGAAPSARRTARDPALLPVGGARPLAPAVRARHERRLGLDLAGVRVHAGAAAAERAEAVGAEAFALGDDLVFGAGRFDPESATGDRLLLHELAHVAQARTGATPVVPLHDDPPDRPLGIGAGPPDAEYDTGAGRAPESGFILFDRDSAALDADDLATLQRLAGGATGPVQVDIYGYASAEGGDGYNTNLSAHRAVAARDALAALLPAGSSIRLHAQGEVRAFGPLAQNRRAGIRVSALPAQPPALGGYRPPANLLGDYHLRLDPQLMARMAPGLPLAAAAPTATAGAGAAATPQVPPPFSPFDPRLPPVPISPPGPLATPEGVPSPFAPGAVDFGPAARSAGTRGLRVEDRDAAALQGLGATLFPSYQWLLGTGAARFLTQHTLDAAAEYGYRSLSPTPWDRYQMEDEARGTSPTMLKLDLLDPPWKKKK